MKISATVLDEKNNLVFVTLFESYLAKFILEHSELYVEAFKKLLHGLDQLLTTENELRQQIISRKSKGFDLDRVLYFIFSQVNEQYPGYASFRDVIDNFQLSSADYLLKQITDNVLTPAKPTPSPVVSQVGIFKSITEPTSRRSPFNSSRSPLLFHERNRGVVEISSELSDEDEANDEFTYNLGIVSELFTPADFKGYFKHPIYPARYNYYPHEESYVARWLRKRQCPVISGSSGSTEALLSRVFPLIQTLTSEEKKIILFAQACNMVANGHHSIFEAMIVAESFGYVLETKPTLLEFYLQGVPEVIQKSEAFHDFLASEAIQSLPMDRPMTPLEISTSEEDGFFDEISMLTT
ncbi:hypothetical protein [Legionella impletisoli]|nr:hypothetical protein [Legionella impletisoli]